VAGRGRLGIAAAIGSVVLAGCGAASGSRATANPAPPAAATASARTPDGDWTRFDFNARRSGVGPSATGITRKTLHRLGRRVINLDGTVDSSVIQLSGVRVKGHKRDVIVFTTTYGRTLALDPRSGARLWQFTPRDISRYQGSAQFTTATPVADPDRSYVYAASPDGLIHKLKLTNGHQVWARSVTRDPGHEKVASALNISGGSVVLTTGGYIGDAPPYQGHIVLLNRRTGHPMHVWNSLCSHRRAIINPSSCSASDAAVWGRAGAVIVPGSGNILLSTGNGPFDGSSNWGDSLLELGPKLRPLVHWTPANQQQLNENDTDLGSTSPALLPGGLVVQGGKSGLLSLLALKRLPRMTGAGGHRLGGALQSISAPGGVDMFTAPVVWEHGGHTWLFVATDGGTSAYVLGSDRRLRVRWHDAAAGTSPVLAGGLLYVYDERDGRLEVRNPVSGHVLDSLHAAAGHWNSPIVVGGRIILPVGDANRHATTGRLLVYHLPGR
jgi:outer membrane protein assembly factor BamB